MIFTNLLKDVSLVKYKIGMISLFFLALFLRFWKISQFNSFVFDEVYYAKYANYYLIGTDFFNSHPPLSQYIIAIGIWLGSHFPASPDTINDLTGSMRSTFSYRWINAFIGSFIPIIVGAIAYQLTQRRSYSLITTLLVVLDGLFLVESRYALNNIYLVLFGLLGQFCFLLSLRTSNQNIYLILSGIFLGCSIAVKWNGLAFLLGIILIIFLLKTNLLNKNHKINLNWIKITLYLLIIPLLTYSVLWIPHLIMNPQYNFLEVHQEILSFHQKITGNDSKIHPYCSPWYSWLLMWRPIAYFYETKTVANQKIIYDVHAMGNPLLWWFSTLAIIMFFLIFILKVFKKNLAIDPLLLIYILSNFIANLLPWIAVSRCTFIYHYLGAYVFAILALAWIIEAWLYSDLLSYQILGKLTLILIAVAFVYWLPIYLGLPLTEKQYSIRMIFNNWI
ncbi:dolichyl-phosphate-mannose--protein O-mannosyl transferase [Aphanothece hegewaldii CCALA 016]|uniref:Polyprenol-phosphate-mannose--protein mannosyltransferase n=1 Tax=Aphanothece hegewaldii CCALA 016 TaxID=2107694 RepID=A0A2T1M2E2_9CHRO|nr:phospholipid carrier-dependent glycosyltransferase [Aphanothece hegewaldii]PSF38928.1 dolichyl-phosphate-mannose--protein O-mannosyl transferase [Aphanothece hegewaldii CCALA 016]